MPLEVETIVEQAVLRFKQVLGWKTSFIDPEDVENFKNVVRWTIQQARKP